MSRRLRDDRGFSLIEMVVTVSLLLLAVVPMYSFFESMTTKTNDAAAMSHLQADVKLKLDGIVRDLRQAYTGDSALPPIQTLGANTITFLSPDRATPYHLRKFSYRLNAAALEQSVTPSTNTGSPPWSFPGVSGVWVPQLSNVTALSFVYRDAAGVATAVAANIRTIAVSITVDPTSTSRAPGPQTYSATVDLRSMR